MTWENDVPFGQAVRQVLIHEGGYVDHRNDPGGATNYGISLRYLRERGVELGDIDGDGDIDADDIRALTREQAIAIYYDRFWLPHHYGRMPRLIGAKALDLAVVMGPKQANQLVQRALSVVPGDNGGTFDLVDDGIIGRTTLSIAAARGAGEAAWGVRYALRASSEMFFRWLAATRAGSEDFLDGWVRRSRW